jgi:hypothetical protein
MSGGYAPKRGDQNDGQGQTDSDPIDSVTGFAEGFGEIGMFWHSNRRDPRPDEITTKDPRQDPRQTKQPLDEPVHANTT